MHEELTNICMGGHLRVWEEGFQQICHPYRVTWVASLFCFPSNTAWRCSIHPPSPWDLKLTYSHKWAKPFWWAKNMISYSNLQCSNWKVSFDPNVVCNSMYTSLDIYLSKLFAHKKKRCFHGHLQCLSLESFLHFLVLVMQHRFNQLGFCIQHLPIAPKT